MTSIVRPLRLIYETCLHTGVFPDNWTKAIVLPIHKKESRQLKKNCRPISLLPVCGKIYEKVIFDTMYKVCSMAFGRVLLQYRSTETVFWHLRHPAENNIINRFLCPLFLKSETRQLNMNDVIKLNRNLG